MTLSFVTGLPSCESQASEEDVLRVGERMSQVRIVSFWFVSACGWCTLAPVRLPEIWQSLTYTSIRTQKDKICF